MILFLSKGELVRHTVSAYLEQGWKKSLKWPPVSDSWLVPAVEFQYCKLYVFLPPKHSWIWWVSVWPQCKQTIAVKTENKYLDKTLFELSFFPPTGRFLPCYASLCTFCARCKVWIHFAIRYERFYDFFFFFLWAHWPLPIAIAHKMLAHNLYYSMPLRTQGFWTNLLGCTHLWWALLSPFFWLKFHIMYYLHFLQYAQIAPNILWGLLAKAHNETLEITAGKEMFGAITNYAAGKKRQVNTTADKLQTIADAH